jgi:hypothetical protein
MRPASVARTLLPFVIMRAVPVFIIAAALIAAFVTHQKQQEPAAPPATEKSALVQTSTPRPASEHNWPKKALDRAADVRRQVAEQRQQNQGE